MSSLRLRFFTVQEGRLVKAPQNRVIGLWEEKRPWDPPDVDDLRIITVLCDEKLRPYTWHCIRVAVRDGWITTDSWMKASRAYVEDKSIPFGLIERAVKLTVPGRPPAVREILKGWPEDLVPQLAAAMDVSAEEIAKREGIVGGPLFMWPSVTVLQGLNLIDTSKLRQHVD